MRTQLKTDRLTLDRFAKRDTAALVAALADPAIARMTARIPYPYSIEDAWAFFVLMERGWTLQREFAYAVRREGALIGSVGLLVDGAQAELGYWIAAPYWGQGYACEAARAVCAEGFAALDIAAIAAGHFIDNPASARVLEKLGFAPLEGSAGERSTRFSIARGEDVAFVGLTLTRNAWSAAA